ncbi:molybdopterin-dependent oxidoreductase [Nocardioides halotolerans]|uniref:molybdopterin-dependent oxidoreductase n=1 Tax=Nocardioides halotolerans TaxID=433660 RepID=UPI00048BBABC|nr:molybdopterin-dependent oxidoreductase [Nocardioides halotolerans]
MRTFRGAWSVAGLAAGVAGLATSYFVAMAMTLRDSPVVAVANLVVKLTPGWLAHYLIEQVGKLDKPLLLLGIFVVLALVFAWAGRLARRIWWAPALVYGVLTMIGAIAAREERGSSAVDVVPVAVGFVTWLVALSLLTEPLRRAELAAPAPAPAPAPAVPDVTAVDRLEPASVRADHTRRTFVIRAGILAVGAVVLGAAGRVVGRGRRHVEESRRLLRLTQVTEPAVPKGARIGLEGVTPWQTPNSRFYRIDTAIVVPAIEPKNWSLRIHGNVDREITLTYADLVDRRFTEAWVTLCCVSNEVGGDLIGNAWFSGVRVADLLREAGVHDDADAVLQTSDDGWTCGTPLTALTDDRNAMLAVAMNGTPLPLEHGFPARTVVPGLYGYVSACKWVVDYEVTNFADISAYWTDRGWGEKGPIKLASRIDVPRSGAEVPSGAVTFGGVAWAQHTGIEGVEFSVDGEDWTDAEIAAVTSTDDTWVQWKGVAELAEGDHTVRVRAIDKDGQVQTGVEQDVLPDGATGWHTLDFTCT